MILKIQIVEISFFQVTNNPITNTPTNFLKLISWNTTKEKIRCLRLNMIFEVSSARHAYHAASARYVLKFPKKKNQEFCKTFLTYTRCPLVNPPPKPSGEVEKMALFSLSLNFFTFIRRSRKIKNCFVNKKNRKKMHKNRNFQFLEKVFHFQIFHFLHHISTRENEKKSLKKSQKSK